MKLIIYQMLLPPLVFFLELGGSQGVRFHFKFCTQAAMCNSCRYLNPPPHAPVDVLHGKAFPPNSALLTTHRCLEHRHCNMATRNCVGTVHWIYSSAPQPVNRATRSQRDRCGAALCAVVRKAQPLAFNRQTSSLTAYARKQTIPALYAQSSIKQNSFKRLGRKRPLTGGGSLPKAKAKGGWVYTLSWKNPRSIWRLPLYISYLS